MIGVIVLLVLSILLIIKGSDWVTDSAAPLAEKLGTSFIAVTTLGVAFLVSIPELFTAIYANIVGLPQIGLGVIIGSVMINLGLTVGLSASLKPLIVEKSVVLRDGIYLVIVAAIVLLFGNDLSYTRSEGFVLLLLFIPYALNVWAFEKWRPKKSQKERMRKIEQNLRLIGNIPFLRFKPSVGTFFFGGLLLIVGSYLFSIALVGLSDVLPIKGILVGIIFGAIGTGAPNIAAAIEGTLKGYNDAAITETFGANIFTLLITLGLITVLNPFRIEGSLFYYDLTWMIIMHALLVSFIIKGYHYKEESITRYEGIALVLFYLAIILVNVFFL